MSEVQAATPPSIACLAGRTALVTGAFSGLGSNFAPVLAQAGAQAVVAARSIERGEQLAQHARQALGLCIKAMALDVTNEQSVANVVDACAQWSGTLDIVLNNAGVAHTTAALNITDTEGEGRDGREPRWGLACGTA